MLSLWDKIQEIIPKIPLEFPREAISDKVYLGKIDDSSIFLVDGSYIKTTFYSDFTEGNNYCVTGPNNSTYPEVSFIPYGEIWIDGRISLHEIPFILLHEVVEVRVMNQGLDYDDAHELANKYEMEMRRKVTLK